MTQIGNYDILEEIGRGGFSTVYKALDTRLKRIVALKILHSGWSGDPDFVRRFQQEAETIANLRHPNIVVIYDVGEVEHRLYLAMEYLAGQNMQAWLTEQETTLPIAEIVPILRPIADALDYAHGRGIIHRDIKPSNIMRDETGKNARMVLTDFGLVKAMENSVALTMTSQMLGSPEYMAPEQADPNCVDEVGPFLDLYAFGIVAYQMLSGRVPFPGHSISTIYAHANLPVPTPQQFNPDLSDDVVTVLNKMLAKVPTERYPSALAFVEALQMTNEAAVRTATQTQAVALYSQLQQAQTEGDWVQALTLAGQVELLAPGYKDVATIKAQASRQLKMPKPASTKPPVAKETVPKKAIALEPVETEPDTTLELPARKLATASKPKTTTTKIDQNAEKRGVPLYLWIIGGLVGVVVFGFLVWRVAGGGDSPDPGIEATLKAEAQVTLAVSEANANETRTATGEKNLSATASGESEATLKASEVNVTRIATEEKNLSVTATVKAEEAFAEVVPTDTSKPAPTEEPTPDKSLLPGNPSLGNSWIRPADEMVMVYVPSGSFMMGSDPDADPDAQDREQPQHEVTLDGFWIDQTEVTNAQYNNCVEDGSCELSSYINDLDYNGDKYPVVGVNWNDAEAYCEWAGGQLPTEAQWEYAARGAESPLYPWGNEFDGNALNYCDTNCPWVSWKDTFDDGYFDDGYFRTAPVGSYPPGTSWVGVLDMAGNVWEWTKDWYANDYYVNSVANNPTGPTTGDLKVLRGGSWAMNDQATRAAYRSHMNPLNRFDEAGFRCVAPGK